MQLRWIGGGNTAFPASIVIQAFTLCQQLYAKKDKFLAACSDITMPPGRIPGGIVEK